MTSLIGIAGILGMWLGMPNVVVHLPILIVLWPVSLVALGESAPTLRAAFFRGWLTGFLGVTACLYWISVPIHYTGGLPWPLAALAPLPLDAYIGVYSGLFAGLAWHVRQSPGKKGYAWSRATILGLGWFLLEVFRGWFCTGFPWLSLASAFAPWPIWIQGVSVLGMYGMSGLFVGITCLGIPAASSSETLRLGERTPHMPSFVPVLVAILSLLAILGGGWWRLSASPSEPQSAGAGSAEAVPVALIQGNMDQDVKWEPAMQERTVRRYLSLSATAMAGDNGKGIPQLLIWPETAMPFDYQTHPVLSEKIRTFAREHRIAMLIGAPGFRREPDERISTFNRAYLLLPDGETAGWYEKEHLVPFGEYLPLGLNFDFLRALLQGIGDFTPGERLLPLSVPIRTDTVTGKPLVLGMLICYEAVFPEIARNRVADGATLLVNISNDAWFGDTPAPVQHLQLSLLAAVEQGRWLLRSTNTGISALVDPQGRIQVESGLFRAESVYGFVVPSTDKTIYFMIAPWLHWVGLLIFGVLCPMPGTRR